MNRDRHKTENQLINLSSFSEIMFLNTKAEIAPIKMNTMIIVSIGLTKAEEFRGAQFKLHRH